MHEYFICGSNLIRIEVVSSLFDPVPASISSGRKVFFNAVRNISGGSHRLVLPAGAELAHQQQHGGGVLRGLSGGCFASLRQA